MFIPGYLEKCMPNTSRGKITNETKQTVFNVAQFLHLSGIRTGNKITHS
jgi:hypothetical protein